MMTMTLAQIAAKHGIGTETLRQRARRRIRTPIRRVHGVMEFTPAQVRLLLPEGKRGPRTRNRRRSTT